MLLPDPGRHDRRRARLRRPLAAATGVTLVACLSAYAGPATAETPQPNPYGDYFVDTYQTNTGTNTTPETNAAIGLLTEFADLWQPGATWDTGTPIQSAVLDSNIAQSVEITRNRTAAEGKQAYLMDRRHQSYSAIAGFGQYADAVRAASGAGTTISDEIPADATTVKYDDGGNSNGAWADTTSTLGKVVQLVNTVRGGFSSGNNAKNYYQYPRPWRQSEDVVVLPELVPAKSTTPASDGGFPSGHTNAAYLASLAFAYAYPERYQELLTNASELGNSRIVAGMHSPMDVMGGRILGTALAASILGDPANATLADEAHLQAEATLAQATPSTGADPYADYAANRATYRQRLTYGFVQTGDQTVAASVPKGAEALLRTRYPYLSDTQIREVLRTTALPSGYPLLDDAEGWGRLDLFSAASGYGALDSPVVLAMDAAEGGYAATDTWRNDLSGTGSLTKQGTGSLVLTGTNTYSGGTVVAGGSVVAESASALGTGPVSSTGAALAETASNPVAISGDLTQDAASTLSLTMERNGAAMAVSGTATLDGTLRVSFADGVTPAADVVLLTAGALPAGHGFTSIITSGLPRGYQPVLQYRDGAVHLVDASTLDTATPAITHSAPAEISGTAQVGRTLTVAAGTWTSGAKLAHQWYADGAPIDGATSSTLRLTGTLVGRHISATVAGYLPGYVASETTSARSAAVTAGTLRSARPVLRGKATVGRTLHVRTGSWTSGTELRYAWFANGKRISGAHGDTLKLARALAGRRISVRVTGSQTGYATASRTSASKRVAQRVANALSHPRA